MGAKYQWDVHKINAVKQSCKSISELLVDDNAQRRKIILLIEELAIAKHVLLSIQHEACKKPICLLPSCSHTAYMDPLTLLICMTQSVLTGLQASSSSLS